MNTQQNNRVIAEEIIEIIRQAQILDISRGEQEARVANLLTSKYGLSQPAAIGEGMIREEAEKWAEQFAKENRIEDRPIAKMAAKLGYIAALTAHKCNYPMCDCSDVINDDGSRTPQCATQPKQQGEEIATLQQRIAELGKERRKDVEDALNQIGNEIENHLAPLSSKQVKAFWYDWNTFKDTYLSQFDQTKTEGV